MITSDFLNFKDFQTMSNLRHGGSCFAVSKDVKQKMWLMMFLVNMVVIQLQRETFNAKLARDVLKASL